MSLNDNDMSYERGGQLESYTPEAWQHLIRKPLFSLLSGKTLIGPINCGCSLLLPIRPERKMSPRRRYRMFLI